MVNKLIESLINWGPGGVLAGLMMLGLYKLLDKFAGKAIDAQQAQAVALASQAKAMEGLQTSLKEFVSRDNGEHREMLVLMKYTAQHIQGLLEARNEFIDLKEECEKHRCMGDQ
ncbi:hypothetical protein [Geobacter sp. SVR]|uniref:hypothetical protein n=1 Tax=Geobacter sp. SVR TaxID=2495594 RepID=UPI00143EFFAA|nr:hypothetical protein [Geobacter sp. SVR]BCS55182.1 hypothetical protein GSVR_34900 [Geobacter sp. SVR]GCF85363.1 hypothetical protein GSbR_19630 [Geobacter sp. SVR]